MYIIRGNIACVNIVVKTEKYAFKKIVLEDRRKNISMTFFRAVCLPVPHEISPIQEIPISNSDALLPAP